jgi:hypothetical protein
VAATRRASAAAAGAAARISGVKKTAKQTLGVGLVAGVLYGAWRAYRARMPAPTTESSWEPAPFPFPPIPRPSSPPKPHANGKGNGTSAEPIDGECPDAFPVKGKLASGVYHVPGGLNYARTRPDRCYVDAAAAEADGLRPSKL